MALIIELGKEKMSPEQRAFLITEGLPGENFSAGLLTVEDLPGFGPSTSRGKVRDIWVVDTKHGQVRVMVTTDRTSAYDRLVCTVPGKGQVLNKLSEFWFDQTKDIVPNHLLSVPHPNVMIAREAEAMLPVEVVLRRYMAKSSTSTSVYHNYIEGGRRRIYGIDFPEGLRANQEFPMGTILTPTTKAETGHDLELVDEQAQEIVDSKLGEGTWRKTKTAALAVFERAYAYHKEHGLILVDTKYEFGVDADGRIMLIDEIHTPDSSRFWLASSYEERMGKGENPESFDKEILRRWLADQGFKGEGRVPEVDPAIIQKMSEAYQEPYQMVTGQGLPARDTDSLLYNPNFISAIIKESLATLLS